jgi:hypothetical protein
VTLTRREFVAGLVGLGAAGLGGCSASTPTDTPLDIMGDTRQSGDPLWVPSFEVWLVAATPGDPNSALLAVSGLCPQYDRRVGWCTNLDVFICPLCNSMFDRIGRKFSGTGSAPHGLDQFMVEVTSSGDAVVDRSRRTRGAIRPPDAEVLGAAEKSCGTGLPNLIVPQNTPVSAK